MKKWLIKLFLLIIIILILICIFNKKEVKKEIKDNNIDIVDKVYKKINDIDINFLKWINDNYKDFYLN